jgi:threonine aldolase
MLTLIRTTTMIPEIIDLRSDTVTRPTPEMRHAMSTCEVGDDVFGDDPTVIELERLAADMVGTESSLWCPTGSMANQVAICAHTVPGKEVIAGSNSHVVNYELGGIAWNSLCQLHMVSDYPGWPNVDEVIDAFRTEDLHSPGTGLVCLENTHNRRGGRVLPFDVLESIALESHKRNVPVHLDGARIWNASAASGIPVRDYASKVDSIMFCLSKGLCSPAGSMICGNKEFIEKSRRIRKRMGGGLRQAGVLASCGLISLTKMIDRLPEDHTKAKTLASAMKKNGLFEIDLNTVETNICIFDLPKNARYSVTEFADAAKSEGLLVTFMAGKNIRMVTHNDYSLDWLSATIERTQRAVNKLSKFAN